MRFTRFSDEGLDQLRSEEAREQMPGPRRLVRLAPIEIASALASEGVRRDVASGVLNSLLSGLTKGDVEQLVETAAGREGGEDGVPSSPAVRVRPASALFRYGHAVARSRAHAAALESPPLVRLPGPRELDVSDA